MSLFSENFCFYLTYLIFYFFSTCFLEFNFFLLFVDAVAVVVVKVDKCPKMEFEMRTYLLWI